MPLIQGEKLVKIFGIKKGLFSQQAALRAVDDVSLSIEEGETLALVGESGSGKSTLGRLLLGLAAPSSGRILYEGNSLAGLKSTGWRKFRAEVQVVFQDSGTAFNPRRTIGASLEVPLRYNRGLKGNPAKQAASDLLQRVDLDPAIYLSRYPHELSGGQRQRVGLARAIASQPRLVVADEAVSALDVSIRAQILKLMLKLQQDRKLSYLFITHDLGVVRTVAGRVLVMYLGSIMESGKVQDVFTRPAHPYTRALLAATPIPDPARLRRPPQMQGDIPSPTNLPSGCRFHTRCPLAQEICRKVVPPFVSFEGGQQSACHFAGEVRNQPRSLVVEPENR
jgi:oligopeptide/dipeptide ABC transporter ATP-binding protein